MGLRIGQYNRSVQRQLSQTMQSTGTSMRKLAGGKRIDKTSDDAAGSQVASSLTTVLKGSSRAARNAYDGVEVARHAEAALGEVNQLIYKIQELAVQAGNDTLSYLEREDLQRGAQAFVDEVASIGKNTNFADISLLDGSFISKNLHIGPGYRDAQSVTIEDARSQYLGRYAVNHTDVVTSDALIHGDLRINDVLVRATVASDDALSTTLHASSAIAKAEAINDSAALSNVAAFVNKTNYQGQNEVLGGTLNSANYITINNEIYSGFHVSQSDNQETLITAINRRNQETGVTAARNRRGTIELIAEDGRNIHVRAFGQGHQITGLMDQAGDRIQQAHLTLFSEDQFTVKDPNSSGAESKIGVVQNDIVGQNELDVLSTIDISTREGANRALVILDRAQEAVLKSRGFLGGLENRLEFTVSRLNSAAKNSYIARGKVTDVDLAHETATMAKNNIIKSAFVNVLAQANNHSYQVLSLL